jgi:pyrroline-5-carboxylate reductase
MTTPIFVVGAGNMGGALARGIAASKDLAHFVVSIFDIHAARTDRLANLNKIKALTTLPRKIDAECLILAVKPQDLHAVAENLDSRTPKGLLIISMLAGVTTSDIMAAFPNHPVIRAMPNIAATVGEAATAICHGDGVSVEQRDLAFQIFESIGQVAWTKENLMDAVTGLSGSGPAYIYMVIEALTDGGVKMGLPRQLASMLATQTVLGAGHLVKSSELHPAILRDQVTTPGGTTINAIHELEARGLRAMLMSAVETATKRSGDLRKK